jgi:Trk-type K+ transport system membrane component
MPLDYRRAETAVLQDLAAETRRDARYAAVLVGVWLLTIVAGFFILRSTAVMIGGNEMSQPRALFTSVNAATLTGFQQSVAVDHMLIIGQVTLFLLMVISTYLTTTAAALAVVRIIGLPYTASRVFAAAFIFQGIGTLLGAVMLLRPADRDFFSSLFQAASALGNSGLMLGGVGTNSEPQTLFVLMPLAFLGGLGLPVLMELMDRITGNRAALSVHSRVVLSGSAALFLIGLLGCVWLDWPASNSAESWRATLASSLLASINSRTAGLPIDAVYLYPRAMQWFVMVLMLIGAAPAGTAGGLKITTLTELFRGAGRLLRGQAPSRQPPSRALAIAIVWTGAFLLLIFIALLSLLQADPQTPADRVLFTTISAAANAGLSHDPLSVTASNAWTLATTMLLGRLLPIAVLWWMALTVRDADVAVG